MNNCVKRVSLILFGALLGVISTHVAQPFLNTGLSQPVSTTATATGYRVPELKITLAPNETNSNIDEVMIWKSVLPIQEANHPGLALHKHNAPRVLIPLTEGLLQRQDRDGKTTDYPLQIGKPVFLDQDTIDGFHTDANIGAAPLEVVIVQFNQAHTVAVTPLTEAELKNALIQPPAKTH